MRFKYFAGLILISFSLEVFPFENEVQFVTQEIRYSASDANEVFLVWGINDWKLQPEQFRPARTFCKDGLMYSPMERSGGFFSVNLKLIPGTKVDYVFWITKGLKDKRADTWDKNNAAQKDYHTIALQDGIVLIESKLSVKPKEQLSILDYGFSLFAVSMLILLILLIHKKYTRKGKIIINPYAIIITSALVLYMGLFLIRPSVLGISWDIYFHPLGFIPEMISASFYDALFVFILAIIFLGLVSLLRKYQKIQFTAAWFFVALCSVALLVGITNIRVVEILGKPFNYQWLYYSDFLKSTDAKGALSENISSAYVKQLLSLSGAALAIGISLAIPVNFLMEKEKIRRIFSASLFTISILYLVISRMFLAEANRDYNKLSNPVTAFLESVNPFSGKPMLFTMALSDSLKFNFRRKIATLSHDRADLKKIKNVIVFVLESTPAEYVNTYGSKYNVTPELEKYKNEAVVFENIYAHAPATNLSMVSLLASVYPWLSYNSITQEAPAFSIPTISSELKKHGYCNAFFNSSDNRFQSAGEFLKHRAFDTISDCRNNDCSGDKFLMQDGTCDIMNRKNDECTGEELMGWIRKNHDKPFFTLLWTYQTHYPYFSTGEQRNFENSDPVFNRYLNALNQSDRVLGKLLEELKQEGLYESTLVVVLGDHGEAFGRHEQTTHASKIYEENLHVPCMFINPAFKGQRNPSLGGLVDIAPTIMNILGFQQSQEWQGKDLFSSTGNERVFFFAPWSDYLFGYREKNLKYIFNASNNLTEIYDLEKDPLELKNLVSVFPEKVERSHQRLAGWVQYVDKFMGEKLKRKN